MSGTRWSVPLLFKSVRLDASPYLATSRDGAARRLLLGHDEWFTFCENLIREEYLRSLPPLTAGDSDNVALNGLRNVVVRNCAIGLGSAARRFAH